MICRMLGFETWFIKKFEIFSKWMNWKFSAINDCNARTSVGNFGQEFGGRRKWRNWRPIEICSERRWFRYGRCFLEPRSTECSVFGEQREKVEYPSNSFYWQQRKEKRIPIFGKSWEKNFIPSFERLNEISVHWKLNEISVNSMLIKVVFAFMCKISDINVCSVLGWDLFINSDLFLLAGWIKNFMWRFSVLKLIINHLITAQWYTNFRKTIFH